MDFSKGNQENQPPSNEYVQAQVGEERKRRQDMEFLLSIKDKEIS